MSDLLTNLGIERDKPNPGGFCGEWLGSGKPLDVFTPIPITSIDLPATAGDLAVDGGRLWPCQR